MSVEVISTAKPPLTIETAMAVVKAEDATWDEIVDAGLHALGETRSSLYGYGVEGLLPAGGYSVLITGTFTVYAHRD